MQVKDRDVGTDKLLGVTTISLHDLKPDVEVEFTKKLSKSLDTDRVKDKGDRGTISVKVSLNNHNRILLCKIKACIRALNQVSHYCEITVEYYYQSTFYMQSLQFQNVHNLEYTLPGLVLK